MAICISLYLLVACQEQRRIQQDLDVLLFGLIVFT